MSGFGYTDNTWDQFSVGFGLIMGFVNNKKNTEYHKALNSYRQLL